MRRIWIIVLLSLFASLVQAQIKIGGNVYGGGNQGDVEGKTSVTVHAGDINAVFGGARMADVNGNAFVNIDGEHASDYIVINKVYGGNDISGKIGNPNQAANTDKSLPAELKLAEENKVTKDWDAFVRISTKTETVEGKIQETSDAQKIYIGQLFGGGNGDYDYTSDDSPYKGLENPVLDKTYLEISGGSIVYAYGGGNNATVRQSTVICVDNPSKVVNSITDDRYKTEDNPTGELLTTERFQKQMGINTGFSYPSSDAFQIGRFFGGNNKAEMAIRPTWNLKRGLIRNLYSGGNQGAMTSPTGILLAVKSDGMKIDNVFGGCRMADVNPAKEDIPEEIIDGTRYPAGYAARVLIEAGDINNVYGGNDISGVIYGGNAVGIHSSIRGDVYGGGNGSYPYTDNAALKNDNIYGDLYYDVNKILGKAADYSFTGKESVQALNTFRPNAESVSIRVIGTEQKKTIIGGAIYCGGNSATLHNDDPTKNAAAELKIGSYVIADKVFLGNNGENMVKSETADDILQRLASTDKTGNGTKFNSMDLKDKETLDKYMDGVTMDVMPRVTFDDKSKGDPVSYEPYTTYFGSFFCGGNVGSVRYNGAINISFNDKVVIYNKVVGGSNEANVYETAYNTQYLGGLLGEPDANGNKLILNFGGLKIQPRRWLVERDANYDIVQDTEGNPTYILDANGNRQLEWNTVKYDPASESFKEVAPVLTGGLGKASEEDLARRLFGGNIYGGCYSNGHVEGNVVINLNATIHDRDRLFDETDEGDILYENIEEGRYNISKRHTGVILSEQGMDVLGAALNVFGGGYGGDSEIWGSSTINLNRGYTFQIFGGGEMGAIGKAIDHSPDPDDPTKHNLQYDPNEDYSTYINLNGDANLPGVARGAKGDSEDMAECEFIYGGAFEGLIAGSTHINLNNGRIFNSFAGSCNADILGHTETFVGQDGYPWIRDHIYGGNDLGGRIIGTGDFTGRIRDEVKGMVSDAYKGQVQKAATYMEYTQGRVGHILGGCFGNYDYDDDAYKTRVTQKPYLHNSFVNFRPNTNTNNSVTKIFGAGEGADGDRDGDMAQDHSYVLIDIPESIENFAETEVFGAGAYDGLGMRFTPEETFAEDFDLNEASAIIDLLRGKVAAAYGGSYEQGVTRRTVVNVPEQSSINITNIFGGAYGTNILPPCDVYESNVNYRNTSEKARVTGAVYGGNNNERRTLYTHVNVYSPIWSNKDKGYQAKVYGAGKGLDTWAEYTEVNLEKGAMVYEVYGGGEKGHVLNSESVMKYMQTYADKPSSDVAQREPWNDKERWVGGTVGGTLKEEWKNAWKDDWRNAWTFGEYYHSLGEYIRYSSNKYMNLENKHLVRTAEADDRDLSALSDDLKARIDHKYNTNVIIKEGATVGNYAYGGGWGEAATPMSGDVYGTTYIALLGGTVSKDIYASGTSGGVYDIFGAGNFMASANAYIQGGTVRNVYGGGWRGGVGYNADFTSTDGDILAESHVVVGKLDGTSFINGIPAVKRNVYGGGEGGGIYGTAYVTINNGRIGFRYENGNYVEELDDAAPGDNLLDESGNVFGGGYVANSYVDVSDVKVYGGVIRGGLYGGGEVGPIGRGTVKKGATTNSTSFINGDATIYKPGETHVTLYKGHVMRDVFGGGRGFDNWGGEGYMTDEEKKTMDLSSKGYVFGSTDVRILGGEVGTEDGVANGFGNVFGGGNVGFVYSGTGKKTEKKDLSNNENTYYYWNGNSLTEDCRVLVMPYCQAKSAVSINGNNYAVGDFVPTEDLNYLKNKDADKSKWNCLDIDGVIVRNAVFAGGNVTLGSDRIYANTKTVMGNVTASIVDVYNRDLVTIGTEHVGGLYGDGNLTLVDGYRELNITNYGTDYYGMSDNISLEDYYNLTDRERAYFELKYKCIKAYNYTDPITHVEHNYQMGESISEETYNSLEDAYKSNWERAGFCSIYAGRLMNTIQRADFCGIFGSRMVLQGAKDRVPNVADKTDYTVNRVGEVSLNQVKSRVSGDADASHGNYFGIYSIVNYMGALTSDVNFYNTVRTTNNANYAADGTTTFYKWKEENAHDRKRNNGTSPNSVALASGVYLELTTEKSTGNTTQTKDWGYITGVAQLELINVKTGLGGGYVYAKNQHGTRSDSGNGQTILSSYNMNAVTNKAFVYSTTDLKEVQTSGNFVHNLKQIVDDCYPTTNAYAGSDAAPAHYWYIRGTSYVYDQYITAYTGITNAYSQIQNIPLNINASSFGRLTLEDVKTNLYAYYATTEAAATSRTPLQNTDENGANYSVLINNEKTYYLNDPITYWDYLQLSESDQRHFVKDTYVSVVACQIGDKEYPVGTVLLPSEYEALKAGNPTVYCTSRDEDVDFEYAFRPSNNLTHDKGYVVSYSVNNPSAWDSGETDATYSPNTTGVYGQHNYDVGDIITSDVYEEGRAVMGQVDASTQATMVRCYVVTEDLTFSYGGRNYRYSTGSPIVKEEFDEATWKSLGTKVQLAQLCINTLEFTGPDADKTLLYGELVWPARYNELVAAYKAQEGCSESDAKSAVNTYLSNAYYCQKEGAYGGSYFEAGTQYSALKAWSSLSPEDRKNFHFNYDALNLLIDPNYSGNIPLYDNNKQPYVYAAKQPVDYQATYQGKSDLVYVDNNGATQTVKPNKVLTREEFEAMPNEQYHYAPITVTLDNYTQCYIVRVPFTRGDTPYSVGQTISAEAFSYLSADQKALVDEIEFTSADINKTYYYCREDYKINNYNGAAVKDELTGKTVEKGGSVQVGMLLSEETYSHLPNTQRSFSISGTSPEEITTLYVARGSDIFDLQKDRVITVIFNYDYTESDESGQHIEPISERHIINIHLHFESGVPTVDMLHSPAPALPGDFIGLKQPNVKPGAYELLGGGWEIFTNEDDAERHRNGIEFNSTTPVYWYQDGQYLAYYAKTYLGKTYSNYVPFSVANYHDLKAVMGDTEHHYYIDHPDVKRDSKIYLNDYSGDAKSGIDLLRDFYDLSVNGLAGHEPLNNRVKAGSHLEFFLHADQTPNTYTDWTPIGTESACFNGTLHGEGYTVSGLNNSLFGHLCGHVYNLGVMGSFTSAGVADTGDGYVENCWVKTTGTPNSNVYAVFGNPSDNSTTSWRQIENCYYGTATGDYKTTGATHGVARKMTDQQFYNGEVAYNLNGFYLKKRYNDQADAADAVETYSYVEDRYKNPDFLYANGEIPTEDDIRLDFDEDGNKFYTPKWPDDYLFFGQSLSFDWLKASLAAHQDKPSHLEKEGDCGTLLVNASSNRVYRAPAYFSNKKQDMFHFNPYVVMAAKSADGSHEAYPHLTAVDFTGVNDATYTKTLGGDGVFFRPILDNDVDIAGVLNADLTQNLLVYAPIGDANTNRIILANYFKDPVYAELNDATTKAEYRAVAKQLTGDIHGHLVYRSNNTLVAANDHLLVDKQDFNAPLAYKFGDNNRMWYQRVPDKYVTKANGTSEGWEDVSLPFTAELVTTHQKGEITHFYGTSLKGHEYWLRDLNSISGSGTTVTANLRYPEAIAGAGKVYQNTFLWDYYYEANKSWDKHKDEYQDYYNKSHTFNDYPMEQAATPYVIGFPSDYYYEFDLSGKFTPNYTASPVPGKLDRQTITFASPTGITIGVSDDEVDESIAKYTKNGFVYRPNFLTTEVAANEGYLLNATGTSYDVTTANTTLYPFRPYFTRKTADARTRSIVFSDEYSEMEGDDDLGPASRYENLIISTGRHKIIVESKLQRDVDVRIINPAGITMTTFTLEAGETVETRIVNQGVYIVQTTDERYTKKVAVK